MRREIYNPIFNDRCTFLRTSEETQGMFSEMIVELGGQGKNPMHKHTQFEETFIALEGNLGLNLGARKVILTPGERITVRKREPHCFFNPSNETIKFQLQFTPGHRGAENMLRILYGLAEDGLANDKGVPKSLRTIALLGAMGDTSLTGLHSLLSPLLDYLAVRSREKGLEKMLLAKYCS